MTGRELIRWILDNKAEDLPVEIQYRDSGGYYIGTDTMLCLEIETANDEEDWQYQRVVL